MKWSELIQNFDFDNKPDYYGELSSVTHVLNETTDKTFLKEWEDRIGKEQADAILAESIDIGNYLDNAVELYFNGHEGEIDKANSNFGLFNQLKPTLVKMTPIKTQVRLWSKNLGLKGRLDSIVLWDNELAIIDIKQSRKVKTIEYLQNYFCQCTMYSMMLWDMLEVPIKDIGILLANRSHGYPTIVKRKVSDYFPIVKEKLKTYRERELSNDIQ